MTGGGARLVALALAVSVAGPCGAVEVGAAPAPARPVAVVALGDSATSGEGAGDYDPATDTPGNNCHRSANAFVTASAIPGVEVEVNLACSGATNADVVPGGRSRNGEPPQGDRLAAIARTHDVRWVTLQVGANDELGFSSIVWECIRAFAVPFVRDCRNRFPDLGARVAASAARTEATVRAIQQTMADAGYAPGSWELILLSYASPVSERIRNWWTRGPDGCPFEVDDMAWARTTVTPAVAEAWAGVAARTGVRFLDLSRATEGREICARGTARGAEWVRGLVIDTAQVRRGWGVHLVQQSFHPDKQGHAELGRCLSAFASRADRAAQCLRGTDGTLGAVPVPLEGFRSRPG